MPARGIALVVTALAVAPAALAATFEPLSGTCEEYRPNGPDGGLCDPFITYDYVFLRTGKTQDSVKTQVAQFSDAISQIVASDAFCGTQLLLSSCTRGLPACTEPGITPPVVGLSRPCRSVCDNTLELCREATGPGFGAFADNVDCDEELENGEPVFPTEIIEYTDNSTAECMEGADLTGIFTDDLCPAGYVVNADFSACTPGCPIPAYSDKNEEAAELLIAISSWASLAASAALVVLWLALPSKSKHPQQLVLWVALCSLAVSGGFLMSQTLSDDALKCENPRKEARASTPLCGFQGFLLIYFRLAQYLWWLMICVNFYLALVREVDTHRFVKYYHATAWLLPLVLATIALSADKIVYSSVHQTCFLEEDGAHLGLFYAWMALIVFLGSVAIAFVFHEVVTTLRAMREHSDSTQSVSFRLRSQWRLVLFSLYFGVVLVFNLAFQLRLEDIRGIIEDNGADYIACVENQIVEGGRDLGFLDCTISYPVPFWLVLTNFLLVTSLGVILLLVFGFTPTVVKEISDIWQGRTTSTRRRTSTRKMGSMSPRGPSHREPSDSELLQRSSASEESRSTPAV